MNVKKQNIALAKFCGWAEYIAPPLLPFEFPGGGKRLTTEKDGIMKNPETGWADEIPNFVGDLNLCHKAEKLLIFEQRIIYIRHLGWSDKSVWDAGFRYWFGWMEKLFIHIQKIVKSRSIMI